MAGMLYLVRTKTEDKLVEGIDEVKAFSKGEITGLYALHEIDYDDLVSTEDVRNAICAYLKGTQEPKEDVVESVAEQLDVKKSEVSKVITQMKKEKIIYSVADPLLYGYIGID